MYSYKGVILVFGLFLAYETRSIKVKQINDSRYVGMSIYNVVVLCLITAPVTMVIASQQDASFAFVALAIIFCCFLSMALIFVPKVIEVIRHPKDKAESKYNPDVGMSKEDEERYQKLLRENDELQKLIAAVRDRDFCISGKARRKNRRISDTLSFYLIPEGGKDQGIETDAGQTRRTERRQRKRAEGLVDRRRFCYRRRNLGQRNRWGYFCLYAIISSLCLRL